MRFLLVVLAVVVSCAGTSAQPASTDNGRYQFDRTDGGYLRLDRVTGQVSVCKGQGTDFACRMSPDESKALRDEVARLTDENARLKQQLAAGGQTPTQEALKLPTDAEMDQWFAWIEKWAARFMQFIMTFMQFSN